MMLLVRPFQIIKRLNEELSAIWFRAILRLVGVNLGRAVRISGKPILTISPGSSITIDDRVALVSRSDTTALGVNHPVIIRTLQPGAQISIGEDTGMSGVTICSARSIKIGKRCLIGANAVIFDTDFHSINSDNRRYNTNPAEIGTAPVTILNDVFIGANSIICKGVSIGDGAIVAAGAVVRIDIPAQSIASGNPAVIIGTISRK